MPNMIHQIKRPVYIHYVSYNKAIMHIVTKDTNPEKAIETVVIKVPLL